jgi:hypothetical protein
LGFERSASLASSASSHASLPSGLPVVSDIRKRRFASKRGSFQGNRRAG